MTEKTKSDIIAEVFEHVIKTPDNIIALFHRNDYDKLTITQGEYFDSMPHFDILHMKCDLEKLYGSEIIDFGLDVKVRIYDNGCISLIVRKSEFADLTDLTEHIIFDDLTPSERYKEGTYDARYLHIAIAVLRSLDHDVVTVRMYDNNKPISFMDKDMALSIAARIPDDKKDNKEE